MKKILIQSFSGGIDSTTTIYKGIEDGMDLILPINFKYGQKNVVETFAQKQVIDTIQKEFKQVKDVINVNIENMFQGGIINLYKKLRDDKTIKDKTSTEYYTPMRNMLFSTICAMIGEIISLQQEDKVELYIGMGLHKHSDIYEKDYWDITPEFVKRLQSVFELNDSVTIKTYAPFKDNTKSDLIKYSLKNKINYRMTWTCYNPQLVTTSGVEFFIPCLKCEACLERDKAFKNNGIEDGNEYYVITNKWSKQK